MNPKYENTKHKKKSEGGEPILYYCKRDENIAPGGVCGPVIRDIFVIECQTEGYATLEVNGNKFNLKPGDCYALLPGQVTVLTSDEKQPRRGVFCIIGGSRVGVILSRVGITDSAPFAPPGAFEKVVLAIEEMIKMNEETDASAELKRTALIYEILSAFSLGNSNNDKSLWLDKALGMFEARYQDGVTVSDIAAEVGFERCYFSLIFKERTGITPHKYLTSLRIEKACQLLQETNVSVAEISRNVGIEPSNFARTFKSEIGIGPMEYRRKKFKK